MPLDNQDQDIVYQITNDSGNDEFIFNIESTDEFGAYITNLYTLGGEFWLHDTPVPDPITGNSLTDINSYVGWYHIRNGGSKYELIIPTRTADEDYNGAPLLRMKEWFINNNHSEVWDAIEEQVDGIPIYGCMNPDSINYNPFATQDDGSCQFVNHWFLGDIPPESLNNLFTEGGELYNPDDNLDYQGYYNIQGPTGIPAGVTAGDIMMGAKYWMDQSERPIGQPRNKLLLPYGVDRLLHNQDRGTAYEQFLSRIRWSQVFRDRFGDKAKNNSRTLEGQNRSDINASSPEAPYRVHHSSTKSNEREILIIDNVITTPDVTKMMEETQYQFSELIPDPNFSPGIFGTKPMLKGDVNTMNLGAPLDGSSASFPKRDKKYLSVGSPVSAEGPPATKDPGNAGA